MANSATAFVHRPWCEGADHDEIGSDRCASPVIEIGNSWMFLIEADHGGTLILVLDGVNRPMQESTDLIQGISSAAQLLAAIA
jgi:hypothetical protein